MPISAAKILEYEQTLEDLNQGTEVWRIENRLMEKEKEEDYESCAGIKMALNHWNVMKNKDTSGI